LNSTIDGRSILAAALVGLLFAVVLGYSFFGDNVRKRFLLSHSKSSIGLKRKKNPFVLANAASAAAID
jgi:hypothetical protein